MPEPNWPPSDKARAFWWVVHTYLGNLVPSGRLPRERAHVVTGSYGRDWPARLDSLPPLALLCPDAEQLNQRMLASIVVAARDGRVCGAFDLAQGRSGGESFTDSPG